MFIIPLRRQVKEIPKYLIEFFCSLFTLLWLKLIRYITIQCLPHSEYKTLMQRLITNLKLFI